MNTTNVLETAAPKRVAYLHARATVLWDGIVAAWPSIPPMEVARGEITQLHDWLDAYEASDPLGGRAQCLVDLSRQDYRIFYPASRRDRSITLDGYYVTVEFGPWGSEVAAATVLAHLRHSDSVRITYTGDVVS